MLMKSRQAATASNIDRRMLSTKVSFSNTHNKDIPFDVSPCCGAITMEADERDRSSRSDSGTVRRRTSMATVMNK